MRLDVDGRNGSRARDATLCSKRSGGAALSRTTRRRRSDSCRVRSVVARLSIVQVSRSSLPQRLHLVREQETWCDVALAMGTQQGVLYWQRLEERMARQGGLRSHARFTKCLSRVPGANTAPCVYVQAPSQQRAHKVPIWPSTAAVLDHGRPPPEDPEFHS